VLATINQVDPIFVSFALPQVFLPELRAAGVEDATIVQLTHDNPFEAFARPV
jgi:predicted metal-dependent phosphotriesterase family hydrolase